MSTKLRIVKVGIALMRLLSHWTGSKLRPLIWTGNSDAFLPPSYLWQMSFAQVLTYTEHRCFGKGDSVSICCRAYQELAALLPVSRLTLANERPVMRVQKPNSTVLLFRET